MKDSLQPGGTLHAQLKNIVSGDEFTVQRNVRQPSDPESAGGPPYEIWYFINKTTYTDPQSQNLCFVYPIKTESEGEK